MSKLKYNAFLQIFSAMADKVCIVRFSICTISRDSTCLREEAVNEPHDPPF